MSHIYSAEEMQLSGFFSKVKKRIKSDLNPKKALKNIKKDLAKAAPLTPILAVIPGVGTAVAAAVTLAAKSAAASVAKEKMKAATKKFDAQVNSPEFQRGGDWMMANVPTIYEAVSRFVKPEDQVWTVMQFANPSAAIANSKVLANLANYMNKADLAIALDQAKAALGQPVTVVNKGGSVALPLRESQVIDAAQTLPVSSGGTVQYISAPQSASPIIANNASPEVQAAQAAQAAQSEGFFEQYKMPLLIGGGLLGLLLIMRSR